MAEFKLVISDPKVKKAYQIEVKSPDADRLLGLRIGKTIRGEMVNLAGFEFKITGGSDKQGFPMRPDVAGTRRIRALIGSKPGLRNTGHGFKKRKSVRGSQISEDIAQVNVKVVKEGSKPIGIVLGKDTEGEKGKTTEGEKSGGTKEEGKKESA